MSQAMKEQLAQVPIFAFLPPDALARLAEVTQSVTFAANQHIIHEGTKPDALFIFETGSAAVIKDGQQMVALLGPGDHCGEMSLLDTVPASASVRTREACELWCVGRADFDALLSKDSEHAVDFYRGIVAALCERLRTANENMSTLMAAI